MIFIPEKIWGSDYFTSLIVSIILLLMTQLNLLQPLEQVAYDWGIRQMSRHPGDKVAVIAIDDRSLAQLGDWPWQRTTLAQMIDLLAPHSQVIGTTLGFSKTQNNPEQVYIDELMTFYAKSQPLNVMHKQLEQLNILIDKVNSIKVRYSKDRKSIEQLNEFYKNSLFTELPYILTTFKERLQTAHIELDNDQKLANSFKKAAHVVLGMPYELNKFNETFLPVLPNYVKKYNLTNVRMPFDNSQNTTQPSLGKNVIPPLAILGHSVSGIGYFNAEFTHFNSRRIPLVIKYKNSYFPSLSLLLAAKSQNFKNNQIEVRLGKGIHMGQLQIATDATLSIRPFFYRDTEQSSLPVDSFIDVFSGRIPVEKYQDKIVLLGLTARPYSVLSSTPLGDMPSVLILAHTLTSLLNQDFFKVPNWVIWLQIGIFIFIITYLSFLLPRLKMHVALLVSGGLMIMLCLLYFVLLNQNVLVQLLPSFLLVPCGHLSLQIKRGIVAYQDAFRLHPDAVESNRLLGLAFQGQGHLDLAFEKFRQCPPNKAIMGLFYNLALDYERKRQCRRAGVVYRYMINHEPEFRDIEQRLERLRRLRQPKLQGSYLNDLLKDENSDKPILGRYQIEKTLGKGAMGVVYLGKDFKLNRFVAIKTLLLSQEFEVEELQDATIRFFREAEAVGRLKHPHIVSIYDAGEEQDLAYISMEFFKGGHLVPYTQSDNLLPIHIVIEIVIRAAEALDYAHSQGVVHRDVKPANIMYNPATNQIKITDFGIARIMNSNKTRTGIILGTPSYMSPEQLAGKALDGRTDLFSLGVMLYQLLTGTLPFQADSLTTLMFKIANESHPDILMVRADIPLCLKRVVDVILQKNAKKRFQSGAEFANALRDCGNFGEV
ncbi:serine/threonine-protein kinase [Candidatus Parabeggiatoa sp. HSG14]|uniref:serine/threonine-protein kinase n=1 Tax=Candidatus Parabeggiatoa sp. HSG14 TaxID=3055593 RepID=UPI0025A69C76|nr:serine/threonine-protein kinase [Thiotrichales bacterium HSG14]